MDMFQRKFLKWLWTNKRDVLSLEFIGGVENEETGPLDEYIDGITHPPVNKERPPLRWDKLSAHDFMGYLTTLVKKDGSKPSPSTYSGHRSALYNLYLEFGASYQHLMEEAALPKSFKGLKHLAAKRTANGEGKAISCELWG